MDSNCVLLFFRYETRVYGNQSTFRPRLNLTLSGA